jgi:hypothetical protein
MVDLPAFAAAIATARTLIDSSASQLHHIYRLDFVQPYLLPLLAGILLSSVFGVLSSVKILISFGIIGAPLACWHLATRAGSDRW